MTPLPATVLAGRALQVARAIDELDGASVKSVTMYAGTGVIHVAVADRASLDLVADRFGLSFGKPYGGGWAPHVSASGMWSEIPVRIHGPYADGPAVTS